MLLILVLINFFIPNVDHFENNSNSKFKIYNSTNEVYLQISDNNTLVLTPDKLKASVFGIQNNDVFNYLRYNGKYIKPTGMLVEPIKINKYSKHTKTHASTTKITIIPNGRRFR